MSEAKPTNLWKEVTATWDGNEGYVAQNPAGGRVLMGKDKDGMNIAECGDGHRIFVQLGRISNPKKGLNEITKTTRIYLFESENFTVDDCDGTDGEASFGLPDPAEGASTNCTAYSVYIRILGKPGGKMKMATCGANCTDPQYDTKKACEDASETWMEFCSLDDVELTRTKGKGHNQKFENVSKELLTMCVWDPVAEEWVRIYIFDDMFENYLWKYDSTGARHVQIRFYPQETCYQPGDTGHGGVKWDCSDLAPPS